MNSNDRFVMSRIYRCLDAISNLGPSNPCDIKAIAANLPKARKASRQLCCAIIEMMDRNYVDANEDAKQALAELGLDISEEKS